jgi:ribosomal protein L17
MGGYLGLWSGYLDGENAMLLRRTCLMVEKEATVKALAKAKPAKAEVAKIVKEAKEKEFEDVSKTATGEIRKVFQPGVNGLQQIITHLIQL